MNKQKPTYQELENEIKELRKKLSKIKSEDYFKELLKNNTDAFAVIDIQSNIIFQSETHAKILGYTPEERIGKNTFELIHPDDRDKLMQVMKAGINKPGISEKISFRAYHKNGSIKYLEGTAKNMLHSPIINGIIINYRDITDHKQAEEALRKSQQMNQSMLKAIPDLMFVIDKNYVLRAYNSSSEKDLYAPPEVFLGKNVDEVLPHDVAALTKENADKVLQNGEMSVYEYQIEIAGKTRFYDTRMVFQEENLVLTINRDITERKQAEQELIKAKEKAEESDRLKTAFLQNISHEIRTPLNAICGFSDLLDNPELSEEKRKSFTSIIQTSSNQLLSIVSDILTISSLETKQEKINIDKVCVNNIIIDLLSIFKQQTVNQNISLYAKQLLNDKQSEIYTDKTKITQILSNLISNAMKFTHEGFIEFGYNLKNNELEFYVKDSGIGIKPEFHDKIFERFRQADLSINKLYGGTGLGLAISKGFVELLGGKIWVNSEIDKGSTFYFTIPYKPVNEIDNTETTNTTNNKKPIILVAEDEEFNFLYIEELLINFDYKLIHAKDGQETVDIFKLNPDISLILMDIKMPIMDGHTAAKIIKKQKPNLPIVAQSAYALEYEIEKYSGIFDDYLTKPINENDLKQKVMKYVNNQENKLLSNDRQV